MHISCVICSDLFVAADDTFGTQCGHLFHYQCLIQWLERSKSCPQCRNETTEKSIHRIYFNIPNTTENAEDPSILYNKIDSLSFQKRLMDTDIKKFTEENVILKGHNLALREDLKNELERKIRIMKEQINFIKTQNKQMESLRNQVKMLNKELQTETDKKRRIANKLKESDKELNQARSEVYKLKSELKSLKESKEHLEQDEKHHEEEVRSPQKKINKLEEAIVSPTSSKNSAVRRLIAAPAYLKRPRLSKPDGNDTVEAYRLEIESQLPDEPDEGAGNEVTKIRFRISKGDFIVRGFEASAPLKVLLDFVVVLGYPPDEYKVLSSWPRRDLTSLDAKKTLQELNLCPQETVTLEER